jgi:hypothetical protein
LSWWFCRVEGPGRERKKLEFLGPDSAMAQNSRKKQLLQILAEENGWNLRAARKKNGTQNTDPEI